MSITLYELIRIILFLGQKNIFIIDKGKIMLYNIFIIPFLPFLANFRKNSKVNVL